MGINWDTFQEMYDLGMLDSEIARELHVDTSTVSLHRRNLGLVSNWSNPANRKAYYDKRSNRKRQVPTKSLSEVAREARALGMSYGEYMTAQREGRL